MREKSVFNDDMEITRFIKENYSIDINKISKIERGTANIYLLDNKYILKEYQSKYDKESIMKEIDVTKYLFDNGFKVPEFLKTTSNEYYVEYKKRIVVLEKYIDGYILKQNTGTYDQTIESAKYLAILIKTLENYPGKLPKSNIKNWYSKEEFEESIEKFNELLKRINKEDKHYDQIKQDLEEKIKIINELKNKDYSDMNNMTLKNTHGDYSVMQFIYKDDKIAGILDFAACGCMPIAWEVIRSYSYIDKDVFNIDTFKNYVKEFEKYVSLNKSDKDNMALLYLIQIVNSSYGYKQYINDSNDEDLLQFAFFRTNLCRYLYEHYKTIKETQCNTK